MRSQTKMITVGLDLRSRNGFSFIEILVTVMIFVFLVAGVNTVLLVGDASFQTNSTQVRMQQELRKAMDWMKDDLRQTGSAAITNVPINIAPDAVTYPDPTTDPAYTTWYTTITFRPTTGVTGGAIDWGDPDATTQFVLGGAGANQLQRIVRDNNGVIASTNVLAQNIQSLQFQRLSEASNIVEVSMQALDGTYAGAKGNALTASLNFKIQLRN